MTLTLTDVEPKTEENNSFERSDLLRRTSSCEHVSMHSVNLQQGFTLITLHVKVQGCQAQRSALVEIKMAEISINFSVKFTCADHVFYSQL